jgi:glycosyltransferase involved in cell wall biosynthesis
MTILQIVQTLDPSTGGVARAVSSLSGALIARGHPTDVVSLDEPDDRWVTIAGVPVHALGAGRSSYRYSRALLPWLREHAPRYDTVIINGLWQYLSFAAWRALHGGPTPYFVFPHGMLDPWFKRSFPLKHAKKWLYWPWADYRVLRDAAAVIFTSEEERIEARKSFWLYRANEVVSPLGVDDPCRDDGSARETFLAKHPELRGTRILLFLGRLHPKKGCDLLIEALAEIATGTQNVTLAFAGPDQVGWAAQLRAQAERLNVRVPIVFPGMVEGELKRGALEAADAFVLPSHQENFGLSVVEALACGLPVLISRRVNIWREITEDAAGFADEDDRDGTVRLLDRWLAADDTTREQMRRNARASFERRFEIGRAAESLLAVLARGRAA